MRRSFGVLAAAAATAAPTAVTANAKMNTLHRILTGELHFKNKTPVKECNIVHQFGENWQSELLEYAKTLSVEQKKVLERQVARVKLTRYTVAELAAYCGDGPAHLDAVAREANIEQGVAFLKEKGVEAFDKYVAEEAANANWKPEDVRKFADAVKAKAK
ncbi:hypothetical protein TraAM80_00027 [Trypanosoma rangeli]|uniref:Uncharacterized protein n=1 Tax=Trypanosoma rangeli TaxID=5698 RepID=A0A422P577_TRYRA|nr:uncharacterized protein TraAM80_00027 [Trypanosoma rangeli]RNF12870.1 hypothetical protein TraAM80_00027 [Trypanosoma rangeli]|eukprot:RNF12870.1 hypothetical protein TraAM80_00027 [Trypanosoma rangeli]